MFISDNRPPPVFVDSDDSFTVAELLWVNDKQSDESLYQQVVSKVVREPEKLMSHIQRIYLTFNLGMSEQLFASLVDLLWVLNGGGSALSSRMVMATQSLLTEQQIEILTFHFKRKNTDLLVGNRFSVCTTGIVSNREMLFEKSHKTVVDHDPLDIARDFIEYSQLDEALEILEEAVLNMPERKDIRIELLDLLKLTRNKQAFIRIRDALLEGDLSLTSDWQELSDFFMGTKNDKHPIAI